MTLVDVDKSGLDRGTPDPNAPDQIIQGAWKNHGTHSIQPTTGASTTVGYIQTKNAQILTFDGQTNRLQITPTQMKVSQAGYDVTAATNAQLIFNSSQDVFKIVATGNATLTLNTTYSSKNSPSATVSVAHGLSVIPALLAYFGMNNNNFPGAVTGTQYSMPYVTFGGSYRFGFSIDATNINFHYYNDSGSTADFTSTPCTATFKYYILQETAN